MLRCLSGVVNRLMSIGTSGTLSSFLRLELGYKKVLMHLRALSANLHRWLSGTTGPPKSIKTKDFRRIPLKLVACGRQPHSIALPAIATVGNTGHGAVKVAHLLWELEEAIDFLPENFSSIDNFERIHSQLFNCGGHPSSKIFRGAGGLAPSRLQISAAKSLLAEHAKRQQ